MTLVEITGLILIILIGIVALSAGMGDPGRAFEFKEGTSVLTALLGGTVLAFYALIGFDDSVNVAEETQHPSRNYPRAIFGALLLAGVIYLLVTFTASMVVPTGTLAESSGPLLEVVEAGPLSIPTKLFAAIALLAVSNGALINMIMASRIIYGMGDQGVMPTVFSSVHRSRRTPWVSILFTTAIALLVLIAIGRNDEALSTLGSTTVILLLIAFVMVNISVLVLRRDEVGHEHFRIPTVFPILGAVGRLGAPDVPGHKRHYRFEAGGDPAVGRSRPLRLEPPVEAEPGSGDAPIRVAGLSHVRRAGRLGPRRRKAGGGLRARRER